MSLTSIDNKSESEFKDVWQPKVRFSENFEYSPMNKKSKKINHFQYTKNIDSA